MPSTLKHACTCVVVYEAHFNIRPVVLLGSLSTGTLKSLFKISTVLLQLVLLPLRAHLIFRCWLRRVTSGQFPLVGEASVRSTAGRLGRTEADLTKSSTAGGAGCLPATIMNCEIVSARREEGGRGRETRREERSVEGATPGPLARRIP